MASQVVELGSIPSGATNLEIRVGELEYPVPVEGTGSVSTRNGTILVGMFLGYIQDSPLWVRLPSQ